MVTPEGLSSDARRVMRQSFAGLLWSKQFYAYEVRRWLKGDPAAPEPPAERLRGRNHEWTHLYNTDVIYKVECPTGSGRMLTLWEVATEISLRLSRVFLCGPDGHRPVYGGTEKF